MRLFLLLVLLGLNCHSQVIRLGDTEGMRNSSLNPLNNSFEVYFNDRVEHVDLGSYNRTSSPLFVEDSKLDIESPVLSSKIVHLGKTPYFVHPQGGLVHMLKNDSLQRIDNSFNHRMQYGSLIFTDNGKIFKYGGYGFWSNRNFFTFYDTAHAEWDILQALNSDQYPAGSSSTMGIQEEEKIYLFGGQFINPYNPKEWLANDEVWSFDFKKLRWDYLGSMSPPLPLPVASFQYRNKLVLLYTNGVILIDIQGNSKTVFQHGPATDKAKGINYAGYHQGKFYLHISIGSSHFLRIIDEEDFFGPVISESRLYTNPSYWMGISLKLLLGAVMIALLIWLIFRWYRNKNKVHLLENGLRYRSKFVEFDKRQMKVLRLLINHLEVPSGDILALVEREQYSPAHNERLKVQLVKDLNLKLKTLFSEHDDLIKNFKSRKDRRIRVYKISRQYF